MAKGFQKGDPRAVIAGRKGGKALKALRPHLRSLDYQAGYNAGWVAAKRSEKKGYWVA
jgi:hypothetical protein